MADSFGLKLGIEGEREFKKGLKDINDTMKVLGSEMTLVASKFDKQDKSVQALNARNSVLNREISEQKNKIDLLQKALANATLSFGEADSRTKAWQEKLNKAQAELNGMEKELDQNNKALKTAGDEYDDAGKESKKFGEEVKDSGEKAEKSGHKLETLGKIAKGLGVAFTAAFAAMGVAVKKVVGVIGDCVDVYADFDDSMRQVAATMGMSADEIGQAGGDFERLAQAAKDAGASTRYTASDAADALNYLALAGYDTNKAIAENTDMLVSSAEMVIGSLIDGLNMAAPNLVAVAVPLLLTLADGILSSLPSILSAGHEILMTLASGLTQAAPELLSRLSETVVLIAQSFTENAPVFLATAVTLGEALLEGILSALTGLASFAPELLANFGEMLAEGLPAALFFVISALTDALPVLLSTAFSLLESD